MMAPPAGLLALCISMLAFVQDARASDNVASVATSEFKSRFVDIGIVPEVIAALDPAVSFYASYKAQDGHDELLVPGSSLTLSEAQFPFEFSVENLFNASNITVATRYLIYLLDADAPSRADPTARNLRHYLQGNYTLSSSNSSVLTTATRLFVSSAFGGQPFSPFIAPNPLPNTGVHRFIYALYTQPVNFASANFDSVGMDPVRENWNLSAWRSQLGLGPAIGATFFTIDTDANGGAGTSGSPGGAGNGGNGAGNGNTGTPPPSAAAGLPAPIFAAAFTAIAAAVGLVAMI